MGNFLIFGLLLVLPPGPYDDLLRITASENISTNGNLCFKVFKLQLKVMKKMICYLKSAWVKQIDKS